VKVVNGWCSGMTSLGWRSRHVSAMAVAWMPWGRASAVRTVATSEIPGACDATIQLPDTIVALAGAKLGIEIPLGVATVQIPPIGKGLATLHHRQTDIDV
jgi:hypothetical protein